jgi:phage terminase large subunit
MNQDEIKEAQRLIGERYQRDWVFYIEHGLGFYTWSKMREIIRSVQENRKTIIISCHGSSKTFTAALITLTYLQLNLTFNEKEETNVITSAPSFRQVKDLLWRRINEIFVNSRIHLKGECLQTEIKTDKKDCFALGFSTDTAHSAEGWHAWNQLFILDEGKGIEPWLWDMVRAQMGGGNAKVLVLSTTDGVEPGSNFFNAAKSPQYDEWNRIFIDCKELPSFTGEKFQRYKWNDTAGIDFEREEKTFEELRISISTPLWEKENLKDWGKDSVLYLTKCRGQIVDELPDQIIPLWKVEQMYKNYENPDFDDTGTESVGIDVARFGDDSTCGWRKKGLKYIQGPIEVNKREAFEIIDYFEKIGLLPDKYIEIKVDDTGVGGGVTGELKRRGYKNVVPICFNQVPNDPDHYRYAIDEMWFEIAKIINTLACPKSDELTKQLTSRKSIKMTDKGQRRIEAKDDYKKRTAGKSPDLADSFLLTWYKVYKKKFRARESNIEVY